ncbi:hypothetical protein ACLOJK_026875 [Asimina triloba]
MATTSSPDPALSPYQASSCSAPSIYSGNDDIVSPSILTVGDGTATDPYQHLSRGIRQQCIQAASIDPGRQQRAMGNRGIYPPDLGSDHG